MGMMPPGGGPPPNPEMGAALAQMLASQPPTQPPPPMGAMPPGASPTGAPPQTGMGAMDPGAGGKDLRSKASAVIMGLQDLKTGMPAMAPQIDAFVAQIMDAAGKPTDGPKPPSSGHASEMPPPPGPGM